MFAATLVTAVAAVPVLLAAWRIFQRLTRPTPPVAGRHRLAAAVEPYRPHRATGQAVPIVPGHPDPDATGVTLVRDMAIPVPAARRQAPLSDDVTRLMNALAADLDEPTREVSRIQ
jgi:hypothetical protein